MELRMRFRRHHLKLGYGILNDPESMNKAYPIRVNFSLACGIVDQRAHGIVADQERIELLNDPNGL
jgi:hypothetical protein